MLYISNRQRNLIGYVREIWEKGGGWVKGVKGGGEVCVQDFRDEDIFSTRL